MTPRTYWSTLFVITLAGWLLRVAMTAHFVGFSAPPDPRDGLDQLDYEQFAYHLSIGAGYTLEDGTPTARRSPGTSFLLVPVYVLCGRNMLAAHHWWLLLSALTIPLAAELLRRVWGPWPALICAAVTALNPGLTYYAMFLWSESPFAFFATVGTWLSVRSLQSDRPTRWNIAAGLVWGFAILLRPQILLMGPVAIIVWLVWGQRNWSLARNVAIQTVLACALVVPWVVRNAIVMEKAAIATVVGGHTFWGAHNSVTLNDPHFRGDWLQLSHLTNPQREWPVAEVPQEAAAWRYAFEDLRADAHQIPALFLAKFIRLLSPFERTPNRPLFWAFAGLWIVTLPGLVCGWREVQRRDPALAAVIGVQFAATVLCCLMFYGGGRFRHVYEPLLMGIAVVGWARLGRLALAWGPALFRMVPAAESAGHSSVGLPDRVRHPATPSAVR